jgi:mannose-6-phosphate isomerase-like protein (cupin superfamily)
MIYSRRDLTLLSAGLIAATAHAQKTVLPSRAYRFEDLEVKGKADNHSRAVLDGLTHSGFHIDLYETELGSGMAPHAPHHHEHEEMMMIREGTLEVTISGKAVSVGPGSVVYVASNEEHGLRNVGKSTAHYFVIALGRA